MLQAVASQLTLFCLNLRRRKALSRTGGQTTNGPRARVRRKSTFVDDKPLWEIAEEIAAEVPDSE